MIFLVRVQVSNANINLVVSFDISLFKKRENKWIWRYPKMFLNYCVLVFKFFKLTKKTSSQAVSLKIRIIKSTYKIKDITYVSDGHTNLKIKKK